jgi:hypothetical protein
MTLYSASARAAWWLIVGTVLALAILLLAQVWLLKRTRRVFNLPILVATGAVVLVAAILGGVLLWSQSKANDTRSGAYFRTVELATARIDAFDAKSAESLTLIARGEGQAYEANFASLSANASALVTDATGSGSTVSTTFANYLDVHSKIRQTDDGGDWDKAVALATNSDTGSNVAFAAFETASATALNTQAAELSDQLKSARSPLLVLAWLALLVGLGAAVAAWRGFSIRLREYR